MHGYQKLQGLDGVKMFFGQAGIPFPEISAPFIMGLEMIGGIALILGIFTHWFAKLLGIAMLVAIFLVHLQSGFYGMNNGYEWALLLFVTCASLMITGAGKWSLDALMMKKCTLCHTAKDNNDSEINS